MSLSKGIFVYRSSNTSDLDHQKHVKNSKKYGKQSSKEDGKNSFQELWTQTMEIVNSVNHHVNKQLFDSLVQFSNSEMLYSFNYIPAASVITGVNIPDHRSFFHTLKGHLQSNVTLMVALLHSNDCHDTKQVIQNFVKQIILIFDPEKHLSRDDLNIPYLQVCYEKYVAEMAKPLSQKNERNSSNNSSLKPIIVIFEDLESFSPGTVEDFILICSKYTSKFRIQLIFGISTAATTIQTILPYKALAEVILYSFSSEPATVHLTQIIDAVLMKEDFPFKLGHRVFKLLLDNFLYHDFSISNFVSGLKFSMLEHFYNNPLNYLCCRRKKQKKLIRHMEATEFDKFRRVVSFMSYVENQPNEEQKKLLLDDDHFKKVLKDFLKKVQIHHKRLVIILSALMSFVQDIPGYPLGKQMRESYSLCLQGDLTETDGFKKAFKILSLSSKTDLLNRLNNLQKSLHENSADFEDEIILEINSIVTQSLTLIDEIDKKQLAYLKRHTATSSIELTKATNRYQLQEQLMEISLKKKLPTEFEAIRNKILLQLEQFLKKTLTAPTKNVFHELFYFDDVSTIKRHFIVSPRACLQRALSNPAHYLKCDCCKLKTDESILSTMPDLCITYKLMQESGRLVNLYDWLQAFHTVVTGDESSKKPDDIIQARFIHAVSELQFLGYIKPTKKKTDHMARLTWG